MSRIKGPLTGETKRRILWVFIFAFLLYAVLIAKLVQIQIKDAKQYTQTLEKQNNIKIELSSGRGIIYDRNNKPLTDSKSEKIMIIEKRTFELNSENVNLIKKLTDLDDSEIYDVFQKSSLSNVVEFTVKNVDEEQTKKLEEMGIMIENKKIRYSLKGILSHTIGYISKSDKDGQQGIEKAQNSILQNGNQDYVEVFKAGQSGKKASYDIGLLKGSIKTKRSSEDDKHLKLTIDKDIQEIIEKSVDKIQNPSSAIISSVQTGEILAMVSRPNYNQNDISKYLNSIDGNLQNRTIKYQYPAGSVFKIVVAFAALDNKIIDENYTNNCTGTIKVGEREVKCHKREGHGVLNLEQAFASSCNTAFIDIAKKVGKEEILKAAKTLHLTQKVEIGIDEEKESKEITADSIDIGNLALGQGNIQLTPLQVNQMTQVIANNGLYNQLHIYDSVIDNNKNIIKAFESKKSDDLISPYTISKVKKMMKSVASEGTAKDLVDLRGGAAVKTGSAQSKNKNGEPITHGWVTGYYPASNPKYAITVLVENTDEGSKTAVSIFKDICEKIK